MKVSFVNPFTEIQSKVVVEKNTTLILQNAKSSYSVEERMKGFENLQDFIETKIQRKEKFFIGRLSGNETRFCGQVLCGKNARPMLQTMAQTPGIHITSQETLKNYVQCYVNAVRNCDMLGIWDNVMYSQAIDFYNFSKKMIPQKPIFHSCALEPFYFFCPSKYNNGVDCRLDRIWKGKRILVISSHINTIKQQVKNLDKIFKPYKIFNNNTFTFVCPPKTMAFNHENKDWVGHFEDFKKRVDGQEFDIALVSCGGYGMPICDYIYSSMNKSCMYLGGPLQLLFGIMGKRWLNHETLKEYYNEFWTRPLEEDRPINHHLCEHGHYW